MNALKYSLIGALIFLFSACNSDKPQTDEAAKSAEPSIVELTTDQVKNAGVVSEFPELRAISKTIQATGKLEVPPQNRVSVSAPMGGFIKSTNLLEGMHVHRGDVLAELEHQDILKLQEDFLEAKERKQWLSQELDRQRTLRKNEANAVKSLQQAESEFSTAQIRLIGLTERLKMLGINPSNFQKENMRSTIQIRATQEGYVTAVQANAGKFVSPNDVLFELINTEHLHAELQVNEKFIGDLREGQKVHFELANQPGTKYDAEVYLIGRSLTENRAIRVHGHIKSEDVSLVPGLFIEAMIETGRDSMVSVPQQAVVRFGGRPVVFEEIKNGKYQVLPIEILGEENGFIAIKSANGMDIQKKKLVSRGAASILGVLINSIEVEE
jgi:cobalt-zinc-cadmium efflux system membrane fusion protein